MPSFRKRLIRIGLSFLSRHPSFPKFVLLSIMMATAFWFRTWAERGDERIPSDSELPSVPVVAAPVSSDPSSSPIHKEAPASSLEKVNLNSASAERIETLPGVGPKLAQEIVRHREERGPFQKTEDLLRIKGIGLKKLKQIEPYITIESNDK